MSDDLTEDFYLDDISTGDKVPFWFFATDIRILAFVWICGDGTSAQTFLSSISIRTVDLAGDWVDIPELFRGNYEEKFVTP